MTISSPHLLRVAADSAPELICPYPSRSLARPCMHYDHCGCVVHPDLSFEASEPYDGAWCPYHPYEQHLWLRAPGLVIPTRECRIQRAAQRGITVLDSVSQQALWDQHFPAGDHPIARWRRSTGPGIEVILQESARVSAVA